MTAALLDELNREIGDPDLSIGPSYFMKSTDHSRDRLERVWRTSIEPLLEDHFFGQWESQRKRFSFERLWARASSAAAGDVLPTTDGPLDE